MKLRICFVVWPPVMEYISDIVNDVKKEFDFISYNEFKFPEYFSWMEVMNTVYGDPLDRVTVKRYQKAEGFEGYDKKVGVIVFDVLNPSYKKKGGKKAIVEVHDLKKYWRDEKFKKIPRWLIVHSTEATEETENLLRSVRGYKNENN